MNRLPSSEVVTGKGKMAWLWVFRLLHCSSVPQSSRRGGFLWCLRGSEWCLVSPACMKCCFSHPHWSSHPWVLSHPYQAQEMLIFIHAEDLDCYIYHMRTVAFNKVLERPELKKTVLWRNLLSAALKLGFHLRPLLWPVVIPCIWHSLIFAGFSLTFFIYVAERVNIKFQMSGWLNHVFEDPSVSMRAHNN